MTNFALYKVKHGKSFLTLKLVQKNLILVFMMGAWKLRLWRRDTPERFICRRFSWRTSIESIQKIASGMGLTIGTNLVIFRANILCLFVIVK